MIRASIVAALLAAGLTAETPDQDLKKAYFKQAGGPLAPSQLPVLKQALGGDQAAVIADVDADAKKAGNAAKKTATPKEPKAAKEPRPAAAPKTQETPEAALARLKADPATAAKWSRVVRVEEMGKKGPVKVTIKCDDKGPNGEDLFRTIKIQDLFQVKFSAGYKAKKAPKANTPSVQTEPVSA